MFVLMKQWFVYIAANILIFIFSLGAVKPLFTYLKAESCVEQTTDSASSSDPETTEKESYAKEKEAGFNLFCVNPQSHLFAEMRYMASHPVFSANSHPGHSTLPDLPPELV